MKIETDLTRIKQLAEENDDENWEFRAFLKDMERKRLDAIVHHINDEVTAQIDCTQCGNCCQSLKPVLDLPDISQFALGLEISVSEFQENHLVQHPDKPTKFRFNTLPCPFLKDKCCSNYDYRPQNCQSYPHLHKDGFSGRLFGVIDNYAICPIVFNVYERLKAELWHDDELDDYDEEWF